MKTFLDLAQKIMRGETPPPISRLLGFVIKSIEPGRAAFEMEVDDRHHNPMGYAYAATLGEGESFTTVELKINFLRAVRKTTLTAGATMVKAGGTLGYVECDVKDQSGKLVARAASQAVDAVLVAAHPPGPPRTSSRLVEFDSPPVRVADHRPQPPRCLPRLACNHGPALA